MKCSKLVWLVLAGVVAAGGLRSLAADWQYPFAESSLSGVVKSQKGEPLEGILVRAKKEKATIALSVISDAQGKYRFPKLEPGRYVVEIARADGLEPGKEKSEIRAGQENHVDFTLGPAKDMEANMSSVDWLLNVPGTPEQVRSVERCVGCHTGTIMKFRFDKNSWLKIVRQMLGTHFDFANRAGTPVISRDGGGKPDREMPGWEEKTQVLAEFLAKVRGPVPLDWSNAKILPRPRGRSTRVLFTEYDVPYEHAEPHDVAVAENGIVWWTDWRVGALGRLDPATGEMKYWVVPPLEGKPEEHPGTFEVAFDADGNPWTTITWTGGLAKLDLKTEKFTTWMFPDRLSHKVIDIGADPKRGRIWFETHDYVGHYGFGFYAPKQQQLMLYQLGSDSNYGFVIDSKGNAFQLKSRNSAVVRVDADTGEQKRYQTPTPNAFPRRGENDAQDRIWFAEYNADQIGMLDPSTGKITEYKLSIPMAKPYGLAADHHTGLIWVPEHLADRLAALDPKTGDISEYLLPTRNSMTRTVKASPSSTVGHSVMWYGALPKASSQNGIGEVVRVDAW